jgi:hypothetical protein
MMVFSPRLTGTCEMTPEVSDPLFVPLTHVAVPVVNVAVRPLVASLPGINEPPYMYSAPPLSSNVEFESVRLERVLVSKALARLTLM